MSAFGRISAATLIAAAGVLVLATGSASSQLEKFTISPEAAKRFMTRDELSLDPAEKIADTCIDFARQHNVTVSIGMYDQFGEPILIKRMDGQGKTNIETALLKARTVLSTRRSSHEAMNRVLQGRQNEFHEAFSTAFLPTRAGCQLW